MKKTLLAFCSLLTSVTFSQITIGTGTNVDSNAGLSTPVSNYYSTSLSQFIYSASEINGQSGNITGLKFYLNNSTPLTYSDGMIDIWIGHTTQSSYNPTVSPTGADWIPISTHTQVLTNGSFVQTGNLITVTFTTPFAYNGTDNLVITVDANEAGNDGISILYYQTAASANIVSLMYRTDNALQNPVPSSPPLNYTGAVTATSTQAKYTRPIITLVGLTTLGLLDNITKSTISLYPNPVEDQLIISSTEVIREVLIYDITGKLVKTIDNNNNTISTESFMSGVYILKAKTEDGNILLQKFIKK